MTLKVLSIISITEDGDGTIIYLKNGQPYEDKGFKVVISDITGLVDTFIGGFLSELV